MDYFSPFKGFFDGLEQCVRDKWYTMSKSSGYSVKLFLRNAALEVQDNQEKTGWFHQMPGDIHLVYMLIQ